MAIHTIHTNQFQSMDHTAICICNLYYNIVIILVGFPINIDDRFRLSVVLLSTKRTNTHTHGGPYSYIYTILIIIV